MTEIAIREKMDGHVAGIQPYYPTYETVGDALFIAGSMSRRRGKGLIWIADASSAKEIQRGKISCRNCVAAIVKLNKQKP